MLIIHKIDDFLFNLFPKAKQSGKSCEILKEELTGYFTFGSYKPKVTVDGGFVRIEIDISKIISQKSAFDTAIKYCETGNYKKAKPVLEKLIKNNPSASEYHRILGQIHSEDGNQDKAVNCLIDALRWNPENTHALTMMGNIFAKYKNDIATAMTYYEQTLKVRPDDHIAMNNIGANLMQLGKVIEAEHYFEKAYTINSDYPNTIYAMGMIKDINRDYSAAFDLAIRSLQKSKINDPIYRNSFQLATDISSKIINQTDSSPALDDYSQKLAVDSGKIIDIIPDDSIPTPAKLEIAENYNREKHTVRFKKDSPAISHLIMHELVHLDFAVQCRKKNANYLFVTTNDHKERFIRDNEAVIQRLNREGMDDKATADYINSLFSGMNSQVYNTPVDLFIEDFLFKTYPELHPFQFISLLSLLREYIDIALNRKVMEYTPSTIRNANIILSLVHSFQFSDLYGYDTSNLFKASQHQMKLARGFYDEYRKYQKNDMALEAHQLIQKWAKDLKTEDHFTIIEENEYRRSKPDTYSFIEEFHNIPSLEKEAGGESVNFQGEPAGQMAIVMYCLSALQYFKDKDSEEIKKVGFEIAMLGRRGIDPSKTDKKYHIESIPGKEFTGLQLLAYMYSAFQVIDPFLDTGLNYKKEYEAAKVLLGKGTI